MTRSIASIIKMALIFIPASCLVGCATGALKRMSVGLNAGASKKDVLNVMGDPDDRQFTGNQEAWQYCETGQFGDDYVVIWLESGVVRGISSYSRTDSVGSCMIGIRQINWEEAPQTGRIHESRREESKSGGTTGGAAGPLDFGEDTPAIPSQQTFALVFDLDSLVLRTCRSVDSFDKGVSEIRKALGPIGKSGTLCGHGRDGISYCLNEGRKLLGLVLKEKNGCSVISGEVIARLRTLNLPDSKEKTGTQRHRKLAKASESIETLADTTTPRWDDFEDVPTKHASQGEFEDLGFVPDDPHQHQRAFILAFVFNVSNMIPVVLKPCLPVDSFAQGAAEIQDTINGLQGEGTVCEKNPGRVSYSCLNEKRGLIYKATLLKNKNECSSFPKEAIAKLKILMEKAKRAKVKDFHPRAANPAHILSECVSKSGLAIYNLNFSLPLKNGQIRLRYMGQDVLYSVTLHKITENLIGGRADFQSAATGETRGTSFDFQYNPKSLIFSETGTSAVCKLV